jgi:hypothetical protein
MSAPLFDPARDPFADVQEAIDRASREDKNLLIHVGGDWCVWCNRLESFIRDHPDLSDLRESRYVTIKVYAGDEAANTEFLDQLPPFSGVPHLFVYNRRGELLCSQDTEVFERGDTYDYAQVRAFLLRWSDPRLTPWDNLSTDELRLRFARQVFGSPGSGTTLAA